MITRLLFILILFPSALIAQDLPPTLAIKDQFRVPEGYRREPTKNGSFGAFLFQLPIRQDRTSVLTYSGQEIYAPAAGVVLLDVGEKNLQQCADVILRLNAEWRWKEKKKVGYHFTSGDYSSWKKWSKGERFRIKGSQVKRVWTGKKNFSYVNFKTYLFHLFRYAGTHSLKFDSKSVPIEKIKRGDFFVLPGSPGHAIIVLDLIEKDGKKRMMLGQGYMPAQEFHVIKAKNTIGKVWFEVPTNEGEVENPSWVPFPATTLRRFN